MSRQNDERRHGRNGVTKPQVHKSNGTGFVVFHPTKEQREAIKADVRTSGDVVRDFVPYLEEGHRLAVGYRAENGAYFCHMREGSADWDKAVTLSAWHTDLETALKVLSYALRKVHTEFPTIQLRLGEGAYDW